MIAAANTTTNRCSSITSDGKRVLEEAGINIDDLGIGYWFADTKNSTLYISFEAYKRNGYNYYIIYRQANGSFEVAKYNGGQNSVPENYLKKESKGTFSTYEEALEVYNTCE